MGLVFFLLLPLLDELLRPRGLEGTLLREDEDFLPLTNMLLALLLDRMETSPEANRMANSTEATPSLILITVFIS